jgi:hypothetical protein
MAKEAWRQLLRINYLKCQSQSTLNLPAIAKKLKKKDPRIPPKMNFPVFEMYSDQ